MAKHGVLHLTGGIGGGSHPLEVGLEVGHVLGPVLCYEEKVSDTTPDKKHRRAQLRLTLNVPD